MVTLPDYHLSPMNVQCIYNHTIPSTFAGNEKSILGLALSNVSDVGLQALLESEFVAAVTPVCSSN